MSRKRPESPGFQAVGRFKCFIYKSRRKAEMYLYLREKDDFSCLPGALMENFINPIFVFDLELTPQRKLARADVRAVIKNLQTQGFYLQLPPPAKKIGLL